MAYISFESSTDILKAKLITLKIFEKYKTYYCFCRSLISFIELLLKLNVFKLVTMRNLNFACKNFSV